MAISIQAAKMSFLRKGLLQNFLLFLFGLMLGNESVPTELGCENVRKSRKITLYFFPFCDVILCNFVRYVTFTFFSAYLLETLHLVTQNVW